MIFASAFCFVLAFAFGSSYNLSYCIRNQDSDPCATDCSVTYNSSTDIKITNDSDIEVIFCSPRITLNDATVTIINISNLSIGSFSNKTSIIGKKTSGFHLRNVKGVSILFLEFIECGQVFELNYNDTVFASMLIENSSNVILNKIIFKNSLGSGLIMFNIAGTSQVINCIFKNTSSSSKNISIVGGLHIEQTFCGWKNLRTLLQCENFMSIHNSSVLISGCEFSNNNATGHGELRGGGLAIIINGKSSQNNMTLLNCNFSGNIAYSGGGAYFSLHHGVSKNTIEIFNSTFELNKGLHTAGAANAGYVFYENDPPTENIILFSGCTFFRNEANTAGAVSIFSTSSIHNEITQNHIQFEDCIWKNNSATSLGAAVEITPAYLRLSIANATPNLQYITTTFKNSLFLSNSFERTENTPSRVKSGIVYISKLQVTFSNLTVFDNNSGTALDVVYSMVNFDPYSQVQISNNHVSLNGGALNLRGSSIIIDSNTAFTFTNNTACSGAAIQHYNTDPHDFVSSKSCFIQYKGQEKLQERNISFTFENNLANCKGFGNSIHISTSLPCNYSYEKIKCEPEVSRRKIFNCVAFFFFQQERNTKEISTDAKEFRRRKQGIVYIIPGKEEDLLIYIVDELNDEIPGAYSVELSNVRGTVYLDPAYTYITSSQVKLYGKPGSNATIYVVAQTNLISIGIEVKVSLMECPPGYALHNKSKKFLTCSCSILLEDTQKYQCISHCNEMSNTVLIKQNWWMNVNKQENLVVYGYCPKNHCSSDIKNRYFGTDHCSDGKCLCHATRMGTLCSQCRENYTAHYHSSSYVCGSKKTCKYGWLLYALSELVPVTCLFLIIVVFDVKLTSGAVNGLIYFAQTIDKIVLDEALYYFDSSIATKLLINGYAVIIRMFNLSFFQLDSASFCLWENAKTLDMIAFRYVTTIYSLLLIALFILAAHYCNAQCITGVLSKVRSQRLTARSTLLHGISGFLILSYSEFTSTSVNLLLTVSMFSQGHKIKHTAVYYNGQLKSMERQHLLYAIPAILVFSTLGLIPPLLLIAYPLCYKILSWINLSESKFTQVICTYILPLEKIKPLFDSFQSSFKDNYRFFSGLYFIFRLSTLVIQGLLPASGNAISFFAIIAMQSALIFALHAFCQPFNNKWHNILEGIFLFDITAIAITFSTVNIYSDKINIVLSIFQLTLLYLPLVIMVVYAGRAVWIYCKKYRSLKHDNKESCNYHEFNDSIVFREAEYRSN